MAERKPKSSRKNTQKNNPEEAREQLPGIPPEESQPAPEEEPVKEKPKARRKTTAKDPAKAASEPKKLGRPRKSKAEPELNQSAEPKRTVKAVSEPQKPGRPRKSKAEPDMSNEPKRTVKAASEPKKLGRPRKSKAEPDQSVKPKRAAKAAPEPQQTPEPEDPAEAALEHSRQSLLYLLAEDLSALARQEAEEAEDKEPEDVRVEVCFPFMRYKLPYNDRQIVLYSQERSAAYAKALGEEIKSAAEEFVTMPVATIAFRGGAGLEDPAVLGRILKQIKREMFLAEHAEVSLETNFGEWDPARMKDYVHAGICRILVRAYSFMPSTCKRLGCYYNEEELEALIKASRATRKGELAVEVYYGIPFESMTDFRKTLEVLEKMQLTEIRFRKYLCPGETPEKTKERLEGTEKYLRTYMKIRGYQEYEDMVFADENKENLDLLMENAKSEKIGFGAGAETVLGGYRAHNVLDFEKYLELAGDYENLAIPDGPPNLIRASEITSMEDFRKMLDQLMLNI